MPPTYSYWTIAALLIGTIILIPIIMGLFGGNKFPVEGKVNSLVPYEALALTNAIDNPHYRSV
jgi:hypothetical protein